MSKSDFMLCQAIGSLEYIDLDSYVAEEKVDGERIQAVKIGNDLTLWNRRGREKSGIYPEVSKVLSKLDIDFIVDGEIATIGGVFNDLQHRSNLKNPTEQHLKNYPVEFNVFDILFFNNKKLINLPLIERKKYLENFENLENVKVLEFYGGDKIKELWDWVEENKKEGIILKPKNSIYKMNNRGDWKKLKNFKEEIIEFSFYEINNSGVKLSTENAFYEVQVQDDGSDRVEKIKKKMDNGEKVKVCVQFLEKTKLGKLRFPSCKEVL